jgi:F0F1-type ATP synthase membrane subunit b/b'
LLLLIIIFQHCPPDRGIRPKSLAAEAERTEKKAADLKADLENLMAESANVWTNLLDVLKDMKEEQLETIRVKLEQNKVTIMEELEG